MRNLICISLLIVASASLALAQPTVLDRGVVNAASYAKVALPNSSIAQGSFFSVFGSNLGPAQSPSLAFPLQTTLGGVSVTVSAGGQVYNAIPLFVSPGQINAVLPSVVPVGAASLTVTYNPTGSTTSEHPHATGGPSNSVSFQVVAHSFGIFSVAQNGAGPGVIDNAKYSQYTLNNAALAGDTAIIWGTGLTGVHGNEGAGPLPGDHPEVPAEVYVGLKKADITYRGRSGCCVGVDQIFFTVPAGITGCHVPVAVKIGDIVSNFVSMPIAGPSSTAGQEAHATPTARVCSDPGVSGSDLSQYFSSGFAGGFIGLDRTTVTSPGLPPPLGNGMPTTSTTDTGGANFVKYSPDKLVAARDPFSITTVGSCILFAFAGSAAIQTDPIMPVFLNAGPQLTIMGSKGTMTMPWNPSGGGYSAQLGGGSPTPGFVNRPHAVLPLYLDPGDYTVSGPGGPDVGPFDAKITIAPPLTWTNKDSVNTIVRSNGQLVTWNGGDPNSTVIIDGFSLMLGMNSDGSDTVGAFFSCSAPDSALQFEIPAVVLDNLPPSNSNPSIPIPTGSLSIGTVQAASFSAKGINKGTISSTVTDGKSVTYQ